MAGLALGRRGRADRRLRRAARPRPGGRRAGPRHLRRPRARPACSGRRPTARSGSRCPFTVAVALGIQQLRRRTSLGGDVATGVFFAVSFAAGVLFLGLRGPRAVPVNVEALLFGSLLAVSPEALVVMASSRWWWSSCCCGVGPQLAYATFDAELARLVGRSRRGARVAAARAHRARGRRRGEDGRCRAGLGLRRDPRGRRAARRPHARRDAGARGRHEPRGRAFGLFASYHLNVAPGATIILTLGAFFFLALVLRRR